MDILRLICSKPMTSGKAAEDGYTFAVEQAELDGYRIDRGEPPVIICTEDANTDTVVHGLCFPTADEGAGSAEFYMVNPEASAAALIKSMRSGGALRKAADDVHDQGYVRKLADAVRTVCEGAGVTTHELLAALLGDGHVQDETCIPYACGMVEDQIAAEEAAKRVPIEFEHAGEKWHTDLYACWVASGPKPVQNRKIEPESRKGPPISIEGRFEKGEAGFERGFPPAYNPLVEGCKVFTAKGGDIYCMAFKGDKLVAVIAGLVKD